MLAETQDQKHKVDPAQSDSDSDTGSGPQKKLRIENVSVLFESSSYSESAYKKGPVANVLRQSTPKDRGSGSVASPLVVDEYVFDDFSCLEEPVSSLPDHDASLSPSPRGWGDILAVLVDGLDELLLGRVVDPGKPGCEEPKGSCFHLQMFAAGRRRESNHSRSDDSRATAATERFVEAVFCLQHDLFLTVQASQVLLCGIRLDSGAGGRAIPVLPFRSLVPSLKRRVPSQEAGWILVHVIKFRMSLRLSQPRR